MSERWTDELNRFLLLSDARLLQIKRAHASAEPKECNPAWLNTHNDLGYVLGLIEKRLGVIE